MRDMLQTWDAGPSYVLSFNGPVLTGTNGMRRRAEATYNQVTGRVMAMAR